MGDPSRGVLSPIGTVNRRRELIATGIACVSAVLGAAYTMRYGFAPSPASAPLGVHVVRTSTLIISAAGLLAATTIKWSELSPRIASHNFVTECLMNDVTGGGQAWCIGQYFIDLEQSAV